MKQDGFDWDSASVDDTPSTSYPSEDIQSPASSGGFDWGEESYSPQAQSDYSQPQQEQIPEGHMGDFLGGLWEGTKNIPQAVYDVLDVAGTNVHAKAAALGAAGLKAADIDPELQKEWIEKSRSMSRYAKAKSEKMGAVGETAASVLEAAPIVAASMMTGGFSLPVALGGSAALTGVDVASEAARRQAEKYGDVSPSRLADAMIGAGATETALDLGMSRLPIAKPAMELAKGLMHSGVASGQSEGWTQYGAGDDLDAGGIAGAVGAGALLRGAAEGAQRTKLGQNLADAFSHPSETFGKQDPTRLRMGDINRAGLKAVEESSHLVQKLGSSEGAVRSFAQDAGTGGNYLANQTNHIVNNPNVNEALGELDNLSSEIQSAPQLQDFILSKAITNLHEKLGDAWVDRGLKFETNDGRQVNKIFGKSEEDMIKSMQKVYGVEVPWISSTEKIKKGETTSAWLSQLKDRGDKLYGSYSGIYQNMIAKVDQKIMSIEGKLESPDSPDAGKTILPQLRALKTKLSDLNKDMFNNRLNSDVDATILTNAESANRLAAQTGMTNELNGLLGKEFGFNPVADAELVKMTRRSIEAMDPSFFRRVGGDEIRDVDKTADAVASAIISPTGIGGKIPFVPSYRSWRMGKHKRESQEFMSGVSQELAKHPVSIKQTPDEKFDDALKSGDIHEATSASEEALDAYGVTPIKAPTESVDEAAARVDDIVAPQPKAAPVAPEDVMEASDLRSMLPTRPVDMPVEPEAPAPAPEPPMEFTSRSDELAPSIRPEPVQETTPEQTSAVSEPVPPQEPDLSIARRPVMPKEEPVVEEPAPKVEEPVVEEPVVTEEAPRSAPDLATRPKERVKEEAKPETEAKEDAAAEEPKPKEMVPTKRPNMNDILNKIEKKSREVDRLPISKRTETQMRRAKELKAIHEYLDQMAKELDGRGKYTPEEIARLIDENIQSNGGLEGLGQMGIKEFKKKFKVDRIEKEYADKQAAIRTKAENQTKRKLQSIEDFKQKYLARKQFKSEQAMKERAAEAEKTHDIVRKYAESQGISEADVSNVLKKLGITDQDPVNPIRVRAELEKVKSAREEAERKALAEQAEKAKTEAEISKLKGDLAEKIDNVEVELREIGDALKSAEGTTRNTLVRRREELNNRLKTLNRAKEDAEGMESSEAIRRQIKSLDKKFKDSERNISDLEEQLKQIENVMSENGANKQEISDYLSRQFDIRRLPIESMDNARRNAASYAKKLREAEAEELAKKAKEASEELEKDVKEATEPAEIDGVVDAVVKQLTSLYDNPAFIQKHEDALKMLTAIEKAVKQNPNVEKLRTNLQSDYVRIIHKGLENKANGVPDKYLITNKDLHDLRETFKKMTGKEGSESPYIGDLWTRIKVVLTGDPHFNFKPRPQERKLSEIEKVGLRSTKGGRLKVRAKKVDINDYKL